PAAARRARRCAAPVSGRGPRPRPPLEHHAADHGRHRGAAAVKKTWGGRFSQSADPTAERFTGSLAVDQRLWPYDLAGSVAWARALVRTGLLTTAEGDTVAGLGGAQEALLARAADTVETPMPGYTHLQRAQPVVLAHHLLAYVFMLQRDRERFVDCERRASVLPLGAAALAGTAFAID